MGPLGLRGVQLSNYTLPVSSIPPPYQGRCPLEKTSDVPRTTTVVVCRILYSFLFAPRGKGPLFAASCATLMENNTMNLCV